MSQAFSFSLPEFRTGLNGALIGVPQEISYGLLAFAPLGAAFAGAGIMLAWLASALGALLYVSMGAGKAQVIGPRSTLMVLVAGLISALLQQDLTTGELPFLLMLTLAMAGVVLLLAARLGFGQLFKYLPLPVLAGFNVGVGVTLVMAAMRMVFHQPWEAGLAWHASSALIGGATVALCLYPPPFARRFPSVLLALFVAGVIQQILLAYSPALGGKVIGDLLGQAALGSDFFSSLHWPGLDWARAALLGKFALAMAAVAALETLAATTQMEADSAYPTPGRQILSRLGWCNLLMAPLMMPVGGSFGRSSIVASPERQTHQGQVYYSFFLVGIAFFGSALLHHLPVAAIGGVLLVVAKSMAGNNLMQAITAWRQVSEPAERRRQLADNSVMLAVALITVADSFIVGLAVGTVAAMALFIRDQSKAVVRRVRYGDTCRSLRVRSAVAGVLQQEHGREIVVVEAEGSLFFGSMETLVGRLDELVENAGTLILDLRRVVDVDLTAAQLLRQSSLRYHEQGCHVLLANVLPGKALARRLLACGVDKFLPVQDWFADLDMALEAAENELLQRHGLAKDALQRASFADSELAAGLTPEAQRILGECCTSLSLRRGEYLFHQGDPGDSLFLVAQGAVAIRLPGAGDRRLVAFGPGALFGEMALVSGEPRSADAIADEDCQLLMLDSAAIKGLEDEHPEVAEACLRHLAILLSARLRDTTRQLRELSEE